MRIVLAVVVVLALPGCAAKLEKATRTQAAADFKCGAGELEVRGDDVYGKYHVSGCGEEGVYSAQCVLGDCSAQRLRGE